MRKLKAKKPKKIIGGRRKAAQIVVPPMNRSNPYKLRTTVAAPGGVGCFQITIQGQ